MHALIGTVLLAGGLLGATHPVHEIRSGPSAQAGGPAPQVAALMGGYILLAAFWCELADSCEPVLTRTGQRTTAAQARLDSQNSPEGTN